jgi:flagellar biosynthesis protein FliR
MKELKAFIREKHISLAFLSSQMGYSQVHICRVINGKAPNSSKFSKLLILALLSFVTVDLHQLKTLLKDSPWKHLI